MRAITLYCELAQATVLDGLQAEMMASGSDVGAAEVAPQEPAVVEAAAEAEQPAATPEVAAEDAAAEGTSEQASA